MLVKKRMTRDTVTVSPAHSLADALRLTRARRIRHLPVVQDGEVVGIVSDRDVRLAMPSPLTESDERRVAFLEGTPISAVMRTDVATIGPNDTVEDAATSSTPRSSKAPPKAARRSSPVPSRRSTATGRGSRC